MTLAIQTHQLTRYFDGFCAVNAIELRVERGTFYGFLGPSAPGRPSNAPEPRERCARAREGRARPAGGGAAGRRGRRERAGQRGRHPGPLLPKVFDLFTQADRSLERSQGGLGIGLTLVKRLVELHGGRVEAQSEGHGRGSEFVVRSPAAPPAPAGEQRDAGVDEGAAAAASWWWTTTATRRSAWR